MIDLHRLGIVARFELRDALRSKLVLVVVGVFAAGSAFGSYAFIKFVQMTEEKARSFLAQQSGLPSSAIALEEVRKQAMQLLVQSVENEDLRETLLGLQPLAIFYGYLTLFTVPLLLLALSSGTHAADIQSGAARFSLVRCDRPTWALGKLTGHACLLALGLLVGALVSGAMGLSLQPEFESRTWLALFQAALRAWIYGLAYLGVFSGLSLFARSPLLARFFSLLALVGLGLGHMIAASAWFGRKFPPLSGLKWLFPAEYQEGLWLNHLPSVLGSTIGLLLISFSALGLGTYFFVRRDA